MTFETSVNATMSRGNVFESWSSVMPRILLFPRPPTHQEAQYLRSRATPTPD